MKSWTSTGCFSFSIGLCLTTLSIPINAWLLLGVMQCNNALLMSSNVTNKISIGYLGIIQHKRLCLVHNIIRIHIGFLCDWQYSTKYSQFPQIYTRIFHGLLLVPQDIVMDLNNVVESITFSLNTYITTQLKWNVLHRTRWDVMNNHVLHYSNQSSNLHVFPVGKMA